MSEPKIFLTSLSASPAPAITVDKDGIIEIGGVEATDPTAIGIAFIQWASAFSGNQNKVRPWLPELKKSEAEDTIEALGVGPLKP